MSKSRILLQKKLEEIKGDSHVYFQPPESYRMVYPAIVYFLKDITCSFADDSIYKQFKSYIVTIIDKNPDSELVDKIGKLPMCSFDRVFIKDNLNHFVFILNY